MSDVDLDARVSRCRALHAQGVRSWFDFGSELREIYVQKLYKRRLKDDGKPAYEHWRQFVKAEIGISSDQARHYISIATHLTSEAVLNTPHLTLGHLASASRVAHPADAKKLLAMAGQGATTGEVKDAARKMEKKPAQPGFKGTPNTKGSTSKKKRDPIDEVDAPKLDEVAIIDFEDASGDLFLADGSTPATLIAAGVMGTYCHPNAVELHLRVVAVEGKLLLEVEWVHEDKS